MRKYEGTISSAVNGLPVFNAQISIFNADASPAALYSDNGITSLTQPVLTDGFGYYSFYVADGTYKRRVANPDGSNPIDYPNIEIYDDSRNVSVPTGEAGVIIPSSVSRANMALGFDSSGLPIPIPSNDDATLEAIGSSSGSTLVGYVSESIGAATRTVFSKLSDVVSLSDFATPVLADANSGGNLFVTLGTHVSAAASGATLSSNFEGPGQIQTADGNRRGKFFSAIKAAPSSFGNEGSIDTAFNGDLSHSIFQIEHRITGAATLGQPTTGYVYTPEAYPMRLQVYNSSGWNQSTAGNGGRTAAAAISVKADQYGQGDFMAFRAAGFVAGTKVGSTNFLANPAVSLFAGQVDAGADGVYLNPRETDLNDNGFDAAGIGDVVNLNRSNETGAKSVFWSAYRVQSIGTKAVDNIISATGKAQVGLDLAMSGLDFGTNKAAISLKTDDRIYFNNAAVSSGSLDADCRTTVFNGDYITHSTGTGGFIIVSGGAPVLQASVGQVTVAGVPLVANDLVRLDALAASTSYANDAAAAAGGVPVGQLYRNGSAVQIRVT